MMGVWTNGGNEGQKKKEKEKKKFSATLVNRSRDSQKSFSRILCNINLENLGIEVSYESHASLICECVIRSL